MNHANKHAKNYVGFPDSFNNRKHLPIKKSSLLLTGSRDSSYFKVGEWEAFEVVLFDGNRQRPKSSVATGKGYGSG